MTKLGNYITGSWITGDGEGQALYNAVTGDSIAHASTKGLDLKAALTYAREIGNPALRKMTFPERGGMFAASSPALIIAADGPATLALSSQARASSIRGAKSHH